MSRAVVARTVALAALALALAAAAASPICCNNAANTDAEVLPSSSCGDCGSSTGCDCQVQNCNSCQGDESCCQRCCTRRTSCQCNTVSCNACNSNTECCNTCCSSNPCRSSRCRSSSTCNSCNCESCASARPSSCCQNCCPSAPVVSLPPFPTYPPPVYPPPVYPPHPPGPNVTQIATLPNITIIVNHAPIYVNNTPVINTEQRCGNSSVLTNGTHVVYVYPQNSACANRTCCQRPVRRCYWRPPPQGPVCPPPTMVPDCRPQCNMLPPPVMPPLPPLPPPLPPVPPPQPFPCIYYQQWPYVQCPTTGCYGLQCAPPYAYGGAYGGSFGGAFGGYAGGGGGGGVGCVSVPTWPFLRCIPGAEGANVYYGSPSYQVALPGGAPSAAIPFSSTDHGASFVDFAGPSAQGLAFPPAAPGAAFPEYPQGPPAFPAGG